MIEKFLGYFVERHLLTNLIFVAVIIAGLVSWQEIKKEEMPDVTFDRVRISANYPGATAEEVEHFVTKELEQVVKGIDGVYQITSTASQGTTRVNVELEQNYHNKDEAITEIRNAVLDAKLPEEIRENPRVRVFKTSKKAIIDLALIHSGVHLLDTDSRQLLQQYAQALESQLLNLPQINSVTRSGYYQQELQINVNPEKLIKYRVPLSQVIKEVTDNHIRQPAGHIEVKNEPTVTIDAQLDSVDKLNQLYIQAGFEGRAITLAQIADVKEGFRRDKEIVKVNGHESIMFRVVKNGAVGILESLDAVERVIERFKKNNLQGTPINLVALDDESVDVRNRLKIIATNGTIGICLILLSLFFFLNKRSGFWVAMGIPFTICFTLVSGMLLGYTINNTTLAAVIIVMGIVVDDAIVVAENISRFRTLGLNSKDAAIKGTSQVFMPVLASIITTCIAFIPLFFFSGHYGRLNSFIPPIVFLMLAASLFESLIILPGHMHFRGKIITNPNQQTPSTPAASKHWFDGIERAYGRLLVKILPHKYFIFAGFTILLIASTMIVHYKMKFVMFPHEETREIVLSGKAGKKADRYETAQLTKIIEDIVKPSIGKEVVGLRTEIARSRRGGAVEENKFRMIIEIVPKELRDKSANDLIAIWKPKFDQIEGFRKLVVQKSRWGRSSGSPIEILVQENNDELRKDAAEALADAMKNHPDLTHIDIERPINLPEYKVDIKREKVKRLAINPADIASAFRASLEGKVLYELPNGYEKIDVRLSILESSKKDMNSILDIPVQNKNNYLAPLRDLVKIKKTETPNSISRQNGKRITTVYADFKPGALKTPLEIAKDLEESIFIDIQSKHPSTTLSFTGEVADTRETKGDFKYAIVMVLFLIFSILAILYNSVSRPFIIMLSIPFGLVGVIMAFWLHGQTLFGFFAAIGALGMAGVVINDSIIMLSKLDNEYEQNPKNSAKEKIAAIAQTRLRAVVLTTLTTVAGVLPTAYGLAGYDAMLAQMMLALAWGLVFGTLITLLLVPCMYIFAQDLRHKIQTVFGSKNEIS